MKIARWVPPVAVVVLVAGCGSSHRYVSEVKQAFTRAGLHHPKVDTKLPTTIFNYGKPPHAVSVTIFREKIPVVFSHSHGYRVSHLRNVMVYYSVSERRVVARALNSLE